MRCETTLSAPLTLDSRSKAGSLIVGDGCDPHAVAVIRKGVRGVEFVDRLSALVGQAPMDSGLG